MRKLYSILFAVIIAASVYAQAPQKMSYQAVIRNSSNQLITSHVVGMKISILQGSATGTVVYTEIQIPTTNANGLVTLEFGGLTGFDAINWANGLYFIKTETDPTGGTNYTITGTSQLLSVPFALYAAKVVNLSGTNTGDETTTTIKSKLGITTLSGSNTGDQDLSGKVDKITGKGLSTNDYTTAEQLKVSNLSGTNTGDETTSTIKSKLGITTLSGVNTGDQDLSGKVDKITGKGLSSNDYTTAEQTKLASIASGAEVNVNADWNATSGDAMILNKPTNTTADGSETIVTSGTNITVTGLGTMASPYIVNSTGYYLGQEKDGGIIFYIYRSNDGLEHGLIVSKTETTKSWGVYNDGLTNGTSTCNGSANTALIPSSYQAVTWVHSLGTGWYLPAIDELSLLYYNRFHVNSSGVSGLTLLGYGQYWSSTEYSLNVAYSLFFATGYADYQQSKSLSYKVRAIRSF